MFQFSVPHLQTLVRVWLSNSSGKKPKKTYDYRLIREFRELTEIKIKSKGSGLFMIGGGVPKNFIQDTVIQRTFR